MIRRALAGSIAVCAVLLMGCGIYTVKEALNPPFGISMSSSQLKFTGDNKAEFESTVPVPFNGTGYTLWFKEKEGDPYRVAQYDGVLSRPTIPISEIPPVALPPGVTDDNGDPIVEYTVDIGFMEHPDSNKSFLDLKDEGKIFFFAVSAMSKDEDGLPLESERVEFGQWPP